MIFGQLSIPSYLSGRTDYVICLHRGLTGYFLLKTGVIKFWILSPYSKTYGVIHSLSYSASNFLQISSQGLDFALRRSRCHHTYLVTVCLHISHKCKSVHFFFLFLASMLFLRSCWWCVLKFKWWCCNKSILYFKKILHSSLKKALVYMCINHTPHNLMTS